jgi:hypothetical protein
MYDQLKVTESSKIGNSERVEALLKLKLDLKALSSPKAGGISGTCIVDISERLDRLQMSVEKAALVINLSLANQVYGIVVRLLTKPTIGSGTTIKLTRTSVDTTRRLLTTITRVLAVRAKSRERRSMTLLEDFVKRCSITVNKACEMADTPAAWKKRSCQ